MDASDLLFVYGTLKRGGENHPKLAAHKVRLVGIRGEVYELSNREKVLRELDQFEGTDEGLFVRKLVDVWVGSEKFKAWVYFYARSKDRISIIPGGCFRVQASGRKRTARRYGPPEPS